MTQRDSNPETPSCPACDSTEQVQAHDNPHQGRWLCMGCMLLFDGTSAEWARPERKSQDVSDRIKGLRAALEEAAGE